MIRREERGGWILINQNDHARLAGNIMSYWGNEEFSKPDPYEEVIFAISEHDNGWKEWDALPKVNPLNRYPMNFLEMDSVEQYCIWRRCFKRYSTAHPYASALIALHFGKLNEKSLNKGRKNSIAHSCYMEIIGFVSEMLHINLSTLNTKCLPEDIRVNLRLVQIGDIISLALCHGWFSLDIPNVPLDYDGRSVTLSLRSTDGINYVVRPYPFFKPFMRHSVIGRRLNQKRFSGDEELREKLRESVPNVLTFSIMEEM